MKETKKAAKDQSNARGKTKAKKKRTKKRKKTRRKKRTRKKKKRKRRENREKKPPQGPTKEGAPKEHPIHEYRRQQRGEAREGRHARGPGSSPATAWRCRPR